MDFEKVVLDKLDKIELKQIDHTVELAKNTMVLLEHHVRTTNIESRIRPLENHAHFNEKLFKVLVAACSILAALATLYKYLFMK